MISLGKKKCQFQLQPFHAKPLISKKFVDLNKEHHAVHWIVTGNKSLYVLDFLINGISHGNETKYAYNCFKTLEDKMLTTEKFESMIFWHSIEIIIRKEELLALRIVIQFCCNQSSR